MIGIIAILSAVVVPGIKKVYGDFKIRETYDKLNVAMSGMRSFYLIYNEPPDLFNGPSRSEIRLDPFLPTSWVNPSWYVLQYQGKKYRGYNNQFYLFDKDPYRMGRFQLIASYLIADGDPYYWDDLLNMCHSKGYTTEVRSGVSRVLTIYLPEKHNDKYFR